MEAFCLFVGSPKMSSIELVIESYSLNVVKWTLNPSSTPWRMSNLISIIENLKCFVLDWRIVHVLREANGLAENLAKEGMDRANDYVQFF